MLFYKFFVVLKRNYGLFSLNFASFTKNKWWFVHIKITQRTKWCSFLPLKYQFNIKTWNNFLCEKSRNQFRGSCPNRNTKPDTTKLAGKFLTLSHHSSFHWHPTPVLLPGKAPWTEEPGRFQSMGSLRVRQDWATSLSLSCIGEGNGDPLLYSCLENPRDGGAWWTAVCGVAQIRTWLGWLSSSSSSTVVLSIGMHECVLSRVHLSVTPWTIKHQTLLSMGLSQQEYWSRLLCPPPGVLPHPVIEPASPVSPVLQIDYLLLSHCGNWHRST